MTSVTSCNSAVAYFDFEIKFLFEGTKRGFLRVCNDHSSWDRLGFIQSLQAILDDLPES